MTTSLAPARSIVHHPRESFSETAERIEMVKAYRLGKKYRFGQFLKEISTGELTLEYFDTMLQFVCRTEKNEIEEDSFRALSVSEKQDLAALICDQVLEQLDLNEARLENADLQVVDRIERIAQRDIIVNFD